MPTHSEASHAWRALPSVAIAIIAVLLCWALPESAETTIAQVGRTALCVFWIWTAARVGRAWSTARARDLPVPIQPGLAQQTFFGGLLYALVSGVLAGALGRFDVLSLTLVHGVVFSICPRRAAPDARPGLGSLWRSARAHPFHSVVALALIAIGVANGAWAILSPVYHIDDLVYHLTFPIEWAQRGDLECRLIPFGNHSPSYHPKNAELLLAWLFLPLRRIEVVSLLQVAYIAGSVAAAFDILRSCRVGVPAAIVASLLLLASATVARFFDSGYVDFAFMFALLVSIGMLLRMRAAPSTSGWIALWAAIGLFSGTKSFGLLFTAILLAPLGLWLLRAQARGLSQISRPRLLAGLLAAIAVWLVTGGWWYVRNLLQSGNPIFPMQVDLAGWQLFDGAYTRAAFKPSRLRRLQALLSLPIWIPIGVGLSMVLAGALRALTRSSDTPAGGRDERTLFILTLLVPLAMASIFALILPSGYPRFVLAMVPLAAGAFAIPLESGRGVARAFNGLLLATIAWTLVTRTPHVLMPVRGGSLLLTPLVASAFAATCLALLLLGLALCTRLPRARLTYGGIALVWSVCLTLATHTSDPGGANVPERVTRAWQPYLDLERDHGPTRLAITGTNKTLRAYGRRYANSLGYVNINATADARFHEHFQLTKAGVPDDDADQSGARYYRANPDFDAWLRNLEDFAAELLIVTSLPLWAREQAYVRDDQGFPLERAWADGHPERFRLISAAPGRRIYEIIAPR